MIGLDFSPGIKGKLDIISVIDTSDGVGQNLFLKIKDILILMANQFEVSPSQARMSFITFSSAPRTVISLDQGTDKETVSAVLSALTTEAGKPDLNSALQRAIRIIADRNEPSRLAVPTKVVVYASDITQDSIEAASRSIEDINRRNAEVVMLIVNNNEKMIKDAMASLPGTVKIVSSSTDKLFGDPFSAFLERVSQMPGMQQS